LEGLITLTWWYNRAPSKRDALTRLLVFQDLIVHVRDISHPETVMQKVNVLKVLQSLQIPERLLSSMVEVHNKVDLVHE